MHEPDATLLNWNLSVASGSYLFSEGSVRDKPWVLACNYGSRLLYKLGKLFKQIRCHNQALRRKSFQ